MFVLVFSEMTTKTSNTAVMIIGSSSQTPVPPDIMITGSSSQIIVPPRAATPPMVLTGHGEKPEKFNGQNFKRWQ